MSYCVEMNHICKSFGTIQANKDISLKIKDNSIHCLIGENGSGKSTLMKILAGYQKMDQGSILIRGTPVHFEKSEDAYGMKIAMVYQEFMLFDELTVWENIVIGHEKISALSPLQKEKIFSEIQNLMGTYGFKFSLHAKPIELPVSIKQQIEIVKALYRKAEIIIFDEPTAVLTPQMTEGLFRSFRYLQEHGKTIIFITHKLEEIAAIGEYVSVLRDGILVKEFNLKNETVSKVELAQSMVGRQVLLDVSSDKQRKSPIQEQEVLSVQNLSYTHPTSGFSLENICFSVRAGEILGVAGVAGNGQFELVQAIWENIPNIQGTIAFKGHSLEGKSILEKRSMGIGYLSNDRIGVGSAIEAPVWENIFLGMFLTNYKNKALLPIPHFYDVTKDLLTNFHVKFDTVHQSLSNLSGGNIQKALIARELAQGFPLVIIEDPTRGLDVGAMEMLWKKLFEYASQGYAILLISHDLTEILQVSDRILILNRGKITGLIENKDVTESYIGLLMTSEGEVG